jgi:beta-1,4-N-acetylglucosaminyltransferase
MNILYTSSTGGHLEQLKVLIRELEFNNNVNKYALIEKSPFENSFDKDLSEIFYLVQQDRKERLFLLKLIQNISISIVTLIRIRPKYVISTGAGATLPLIILSKLFGSKVIYIESLAKINNLTITGRVAKLLANRFYVQWPELESKIPNSIYKGRLY